MPADSTAIRSIARASVSDSDQLCRLGVDRLATGLLLYHRRHYWGRAESGGRTLLDGRPIVSRAGAMGLMQLMPGTWADMRARLGLGRDPHAPRDNILAGTLYLRLMYDRFGYPGLFGAYDAGPARYSAYLAGRSGLPGETRAYLVAVGGAASARRARPSAGTVAEAPGSLFFVLKGQAVPPANPEFSSRLFIDLAGSREP